MKPAALAVLMVLSTHAFATDTLDCVAKPYYLSVIVSHEHGAQRFSLSDDSGELVGGAMKLWKQFRLHWPNGLGPKGNSLRFSGEFSGDLAVRGQVSGEVGAIIVNGKKYAFKCDWTK
jgi:hypothetical protein